ncbi:unnamed protein product, partial [Ectocarpus sp. 12 AP-2014]
MIMFARGLIVAALIESSSGFVNLAAARPGAVARLPTPVGAVALPRSTVSRGGRSFALGMVEKLGPDETVKKYGLEAGLFK